MKMRIHIVIPLFVAIACNVPTNNEPGIESSRRIQIRLIDSLGQVALSVPDRYDTVFSWVNHSDCGKPCDEQEYRCQPKVLPITKESGFFWQGKPKDSVDQFTISHPSDLRYLSDDTTLDSSIYKYVKLKMANDPSSPKVVYDTIEKIGDRYFSIFVMQKPDTVHDFRVLAITRIKGNEVKFRYDLLSKKDDLVEKNFIRNSLDLIKTIRVSKG